MKQLILLFQSPPRRPQPVQRQQQQQQQQRLSSLILPKQNSDGGGGIRRQDSDSNLEFFGPSDYKPESPYQMPAVAHAQEGHGKAEQPQVLPWQIGYIPIPRK